MATPILPLLNKATVGQRLRAGFEAKARRGDRPDDCWTWEGTKRKDGYGQVSASKNVKISAHRLSFAIHFGEEPGAMLVCHRCDNPECTNPAHLFLGSGKANMQDMIAKGRASPQGGERNGNSKLGPEAVTKILAMIEDGMNNTEIAEQFGVHNSTISAIRRGMNWKKERRLAPPPVTA